MDPTDETYIAEGTFTRSEMNEIKITNGIKFPQLPDDDITNYLINFSEATTTNALREALFLNSEYQINYDLEKDKEKDWIIRTLYRLMVLLHI
jgi:DNA gyrase/topoisomerase IV subunit B